MTQDELECDRLRYAMQLTEYRLLVAPAAGGEQQRLQSRLFRLAGQLSRAERRVGTPPADGTRSPYVARG